MAVNTYLLHFEVDGQKLTNEHKWLEAKMTPLLKKYLLGLSVVDIKRMSDGGFLTLYIGHRESFATVRTYARGLLTVNIEHYKKQEEGDLINRTQYILMLQEMAKALGSERYHQLSPFKRGTVKRYFRTTDDKLYELDIDSVLFEEKSPYQLVQVSHAVSLGNVLILDGVPNLAVRDIVFTETLMQARGKEKYQDKEIVILGGGNGALLWELLKQKPKFVLMLEHDDVVVRACRSHMREVNGGVFDKLKGPNFEIVISDCIPHLKKLVELGKKFDYVFGDLTDSAYNEETAGGHIISASIISKYRSFMKEVMNLSFKILKPSGKWAGGARPDYLKAFEDVLKELDDPVTFLTDVALVPSFAELRTFYQIWRSFSN